MTYMYYPPLSITHVNWKRVHSLRGKPVLFFASLLDRINLFPDKPKDLDSLQPIRILLADDDEDDRQLFEEAVSRIHPVINVEKAITGMELLEKMEDGEKPQIIFLDLNMPGKNGKECLAAIRKNDKWKDIPVIIYSTSSNQKDIIDTYNGGANLYLLKPTSFPELIRRIKKSFSFDWEQSPRLGQNEFVLKN